MADYLMIFSISPVQSFIASSRKTQDLYNGSKILSNMIRSQLDFLHKKDSVEIVFPNSENQSLPNRLMFKVNSKDDSFITELGNKMEKNSHSYLYKLSFDALKKSDKILLAQIDSFFQCHWSAVEIKDTYESAYSELERKHAGIKKIGIFKQLGNGKGEQGRKCSLCGEHNALIFNKSTNRIPNFLSENAFPINSNLLKESESICSICALKRFSNTLSFPSVSEIAMKKSLLPEEIQQLKSMNIDPEILYQETDIEKYLESENKQVSLGNVKKVRNEINNRCKNEGVKLPKYYALIMYDGDSIGKLLSGAKLKEGENLQNFHIALAKSLSINAKESSKIVDKVGKSVYAGGDDFLGFCSLDSLLPTLTQLNNTFEEKVNKELKSYLKPSSEITMSAGIVIAHYKTPLHIVLNWARNMEGISKDIKGKNSVTLAVLKHSGDIQKTTWQWGNLIGKMNFVLEQLKIGNFSTNFIYTLEKEFKNLNNDKENDSYDRQFATEIKRLIKRSVIENKSVSQENMDKLYEVCLDLKSNFESSEDYFGLMRIIAFLDRELGGEK